MGIFDCLLYLFFEILLTAAELVLYLCKLGKQLLSCSAVCFEQQYRIVKLIIEKQRMLPFFRINWKKPMSCFFSTNISKGELLAVGQYSFRLLSSSRADQAMALISNQFTSREPLSNSYYLQFPQRKRNSQTDWKNYLSHWLSFPSTYQLSVCVVDKQKDEIVGLSIGHDAAATTTKTKNNSTKSGLSYVITLQNYLSLQIEENLKPLFSTKGRVSILEAAALKTSHSGKGLLPTILRLQEEIAAFYQYCYTYSLATNVKSERCFTQLGYTKVSQIDVGSFEVDGIVPFRLVDSLNKHPSTWIKRLEGSQKQKGSMYIQSRHYLI